MVDQLRDHNLGRSDDSSKCILAVTTGGFTHAAPVLELCKVLAERGHVVEFATNAGQEDWAKCCPLIKTVHSFGPGPSDEETEAHYRRMLSWSPADGLSSIMKSKYLWDSYWTDTYLHLKDIASNPVTRPDFIIADFFADAAVKDMMVEFGIPIAIVWPQMPYLMAPVSYIPGQPGFQIDMSLTSEHASIASRIGNEMVLFWALPSLLKWLKWTKAMRMKAGVTHKTPSDPKPDYLVLVNSFFGLEVPKDLPPSIVPCGPILADSYMGLDENHAKFLAQHKRVLYVALGTHIILEGTDVAKILEGIIQALDGDHIDGVIWAVGQSPRKEFPCTQSFRRTGQRVHTLGEMLDQADPDLMFPLFAPQRAVLEHQNTVLFLTHGGSSSANEALYHGVPVLTLGFFFDQLSNSARLRSAGVGLSLDKSHYASSEICDRIALIVGDRDGQFAQDVKRVKGIARIALKRKHLAADLIEQSMIDEEFRFLDGKEIHPRHLQTADMRMSTWRAKNWDLRLVTLGTTLFVAASVSYVGQIVYTALRVHIRAVRK
ncbi:UDP-Glycosyltransferase/glycogen phosphorylase, partial [Aureobasidium melanogenum]